MMEGRGAAMAARLLRETGLMDFIVGEALAGTQYAGRMSPLDMQQNNPHHDLDVWAHTMEGLATVSRMYGSAEPERRATMAMAMLFHDLGKLYDGCRQAKDDRTTYHGHEDAGTEIASAILGFMRLDPYVKEVSGFVGEHMKPHSFGEYGMPALRKFVRTMGERSLQWLDVFNLAVADAVAKRSVDPSRLRNDVSDEELAEMGLSRVGDMVVNGKGQVVMGWEDIENDWVFDNATPLYVRRDQPLPGMEGMFAAPSAWHGTTLSRARKAFPDLLLSRRRSQP